MGEGHHPRDFQRFDRIAVHLAEQQQPGAIAVHELGDLPEVGPFRRLAQQHYWEPSTERAQQDAEVAIPLGAPQHARRGMLPRRRLPRVGAAQHDLQPEHDWTLPSRFAGAPCLEAPGDARHSLEGQRASWAMVESAASAHLRNWRAMWRGAAEVCRRWCSLRSLTWGSARVLGQQVERGVLASRCWGRMRVTSMLSLFFTCAPDVLEPFFCLHGVT